MKKHFFYLWVLLPVFLASCNYGTGNPSAPLADQTAGAFSSQDQSAATGGSSAKVVLPQAEMKAPDPGGGGQNIQPPSNRCFVQFRCIGDVKQPADYAYFHPTADLGIVFYIPVDTSVPLQGIHEMIQNNQTDFKNFEEQCNRSRYRKVKFSPILTTAWTQDSKWAYTTLSMSCLNRKSVAGEPCLNQSQCAKGTCDTSLHVCLLD